MAPQSISGDAAGATSVWSDRFSVGVPQIDADHRVLFELAGQIVQAATGQEAEAVTGSVLAALADYADYHFEREERVMRAIGFPEEPSHTARHDALRTRVQQMAERYHADASAVAAEELAAFLVDWLTHHILEEDMAYRPYAVDNPAAEAAAASVGVDYFFGGAGDDQAPFGLPEAQS